MVRKIISPSGQDVDIAPGGVGLVKIKNTVGIDAILDEDNMASDSATALATQQSIKAYVDAMSVGRLSSIQIYDSGTAETYTVPAGINSILVEAWGGGGGGGGAAGAAASVGAGCGGSGGGYVRKWISSPSESYEYTVGAGGSGGAAGNNAGTDGEATTFGVAFLQASGGRGGAGSPAIANNTSAVIGLSPLGGAASGGDLNLRGEYGSSALITGTFYCISGRGGAGANGGVGGRSNASDANGFNGESPGGAGSGAGAASGVDRSGGNGGNGKIVIWEFL